MARKGGTVEKRTEGKDGTIEKRTVRKYETVRKMGIAEFLCFAQKSNCNFGMGYAFNL